MRHFARDDARTVDRPFHCVRVRLLPCHPPPHTSVAHINTSSSSSLSRLRLPCVISVVVQIEKKNRLVEESPGAGRGDTGGRLPRGDSSTSLCMCWPPLLSASKRPCLQHISFPSSISDLVSPPIRSDLFRWNKRPSSYSSQVGISAAV